MEVVKTVELDSNALNSPPSFVMSIDSDPVVQVQASPAAISVQPPRQSSPITIPPSTSFSANANGSALLSNAMDSSATLSSSTAVSSSSSSLSSPLSVSLSPRVRSPSLSNAFQPAQSPPAAPQASPSLDEILSQYLPFTDLPSVKLHHNSQQRAQYDQLADVFALLTSIEHLEHAYVRDAIAANEYTATCNKMLAQMKTLREALVNDLPDLNRFVHDFSLTVPAAMKRIEAGVPATVLHGDIGKADSGGKELAVFHGVQHFITAMDSLKLGLKAVDELYPHLSDLMDAINKVSDLPNDHEAKAKVRQWLTTLANMRAHEEISADQQRQMAFDLETAYSSFHKFVKQGRKE